MPFLYFMAQYLLDKVHKVTHHELQGQGQLWEYVNSPQLFNSYAENDLPRKCCVLFGRKGANKALTGFWTGFPMWPPTALHLPWEDSSISPQFHWLYPKFSRCLKLSFHSRESRTTRTYVDKIYESIALLFSGRQSVCCSQPEQLGPLHKQSNSLGQISFFLMKTCSFQ